MRDEIEPRAPNSHWAACSSLTLLAVQNALSLILLHKIQQPGLDDQHRYEPLTAVILSETLKLIVCVVVLGFDTTSPPARDRVKLFADNIRDGHLKAAAPAVLYTFAAVLQSTGARNLDGLLFVVLSQLKLILTPIFSVFILRRSLTLLQWLCLFTMAAGIVLIQTASFPSTKFDHYSQDARIGTVAMLVSGTCVALAGILMETMLKVPNRFIVLNAQLAAYACLCAILSLLTRLATISTTPAGNAASSFFHGYHALVWAFVFLQAVGGFIVAWSVRASSTVAKNYAQAIGFMIASIGPSLLSPHMFSLRTLTGVGFVTAGVLGSLGDSRKSTEVMAGSGTCKDLESATPQTEKGSNCKI